MEQTCQYDTMIRLSRTGEHGITVKMVKRAYNDDTGRMNINLFINISDITGYQ